LKENKCKHCGALTLRKVADARTSCDSCKKKVEKERKRAWALANPAWKKQVSFRDNMKSFGISVEEYAAMEERQGWKCAICGTSPFARRLSVDHCHKTDRIRGLLCVKCNSGLGSFCDDTNNLRRAIEYLDKHK
jgi:hypothetical protein